MRRSFRTGWTVIQKAAPLKMSVRNERPRSEARSVADALKSVSSFSRLAALAAIEMNQTSRLMPAAKARTWMMRRVRDIRWRGGAAIGAGVGVSVGIWVKMEWGGVWSRHARLKSWEAGSA